MSKKRFLWIMSDDDWQHSTPRQRQRLFNAHVLSLLAYYPGYVVAYVQKKKCRLFSGRGNLFYGHPTRVVLEAA